MAPALAKLDAITMTKKNLNGMGCTDGLLQMAGMVTNRFDFGKKNNWLKAVIVF
jgi:hypothetical protein